MAPGLLVRGEEKGQVERPAPGKLKGEDLRDFGKLEKGRRELLELALRTAREMDLDDYIYGSADPGKGGFDCSGAVYYLLRRVGLKAPRTSAGQFEWLKEKGTLVEVPAGVQSFEDPAFAKLAPGDLLFWSGTYEPTDGRKTKITHVQIYLGREKSDGRRVMIGSTDGRSYRGTARCGFGVFDFKLPKAGSKARFVGYGGWK
jgi:cell wall-associated NlpC family hydrolase